MWSKQIPIGKRIVQYIPDRERLGERPMLGDRDPGVVAPLLSPSETPNPGTVNRFSLDTPRTRNITQYTMHQNTM